jgi:hypothetical protein
MTGTRQVARVARTLVVVGAASGTSTSCAAARDDAEQPSHGDCRGIDAARDMAQVAE